MSETKDRHIIGVVGKSGAGKTSVAHALAKLMPNTEVIDADEVVEAMYADGRAASAFQQGGLGDLLDGDKVSKDAVRQALKTDKRLTINDVVGKMFHTYLEAQLNDHAEKNFILDIPRFFDGDYLDMCNAMVLVTAPQALRIERVKERALQENPHADVDAVADHFLNTSEKRLPSEEAMNMKLETWAHDRVDRMYVSANSYENTPEVIAQKVKSCMNGERSKSPF